MFRYLAWGRRKRKLAAVIFPEEYGHGNHRIDDESQAALPRDLRAGAREDDAGAPGIPRRPERIPAERAVQDGARAGVDLRARSVPRLDGLRQERLRVRNAVRTAARGAQIL